MAGRAVAIGDTVVTSDANGEFVIGNVSPAYDLSVVASTRFGEKTAEIYVGLTTRRPTILLEEGDPVGRTELYGFVNPIDAPAKIAFHPLAQLQSSPYTGTVADDGVIRPHYIEWPGKQTVTGQLYGLQWTSVPTAPCACSPYLATGYQLWGSQTLTLSDGDGGPSTLWTTLQLGPATQEEISGVIRLASPLYYSPLVVFWVGDIKVFEHQFELKGASLEAPYRFPVPTGLGPIPKTMWLSSAVWESRGSSAVFVRLKDSTTTHDVDLVAPVPYQSMSPSSGAQNVDHNTEFSWGAVPGTVYSLAVGIGGSPRITVHTAATSAKIPDTRKIGVPFSGGHWNVLATGPARTVDDLVNEATAPKKQDSYFRTTSWFQSFSTTGIEVDRDR